MTDLNEYDIPMDPPSIIYYGDPDAKVRYETVTITSNGKVTVDSIWDNQDMAFDETLTNRFTTPAWEWAISMTCDETMAYLETIEKGEPGYKKSTVFGVRKIIVE